MDPALWELIEGDATDEVAAVARFHAGMPVPDRVRVVSRFGEVATLRLARGEILAVRQHPSVASLKAPRLVVPEPALVSPGRATTRGRRALAGTAAPTGRGVVIGVIDWGCDFTHPNLLTDDGRTRLLALWDQRPRGPDAPPPYGYGRVHDAAAIDAALRQDDPFDALGYDPADADPDGTGSHGTHVLDIAGGSPRRGPGGVAPGADLVFVHLAMHADDDAPRGIGNSVSLLEAVDFVAQVAGARPYLVNLSLGSHGGPHDGTTLVEQALDALVVSGPGRAVVHSGGNYYQRPIHASGRLRTGETMAIDWLVDPDDETPNELEVWYPGVDTLRARLVAPDGEVVAVAMPEAHGHVVVAGEVIGRHAHRQRDPNNGDHQVVFMLCPGRGGTWRVLLEGLSVARGDYHVWIERDELAPGSQSRLRRTQADPTTTTGTICNGHHTIAVGAWDPRTGGPAWFSSAGPTRDGRRKPDLLAPGVGVVAARSLSRSGAETDLATKAGTSMAAPHVAGAIAVLYEAAGRPLSIDEVRRALFSTAHPVRTWMSPRAGHGALNLAAAAATVREQAGKARATASGRPNPGTLLLREEEPAQPACGPCDEACAPPAAPQGPAPSPLPAELVPPFDDDRAAPAVHAEARARNLSWWETLSLGAVRPLRGVGPEAHPVAYANRTLAVQHLLRTQQLDQRVLGRTLALDGVLGAETLVVLRAVATDPDLDLFEAELRQRGVALERLRDLRPPIVAKAEAAVFPPEVLAAWSFRTPANQAIEYLRQSRRGEAAAAESWRRYFFRGLKAERWPTLTWDDVTALFSALHAGKIIEGRAAFVRLRRALPAGSASWEVVRRHLGEAAARRAYWAPWYIAPARFAQANRHLRFGLPERPDVAQAAAAWRASLDTPPSTRLVALVYWPPVHDRLRLEVVERWLVERQVTRTQRGLQRRSDLAPFVAQLIARLDEKRTYLWETQVADELRGLAAAPPEVREVFFELVASAGGTPARGPLDRLCEAFAGMVHRHHRAALTEVAHGTRVEAAPGYQRFLAEHRRRTEAIRKHGYDVGARTIYLDKDRRYAVVADLDRPTVVGDIDTVYRKSQRVQRLRPPRQQALCQQVLVELQQQLAELVASAMPTWSARPELLVDEQKLLETAINHAGRSLRPPLSDKDLEQVDLALSVQVRALRTVVRDGIERVQIDSELVHQIAGGPWQPVPETRRWRTEEELGEELFFLYLANVAEVIEWIAIGALAIAGALLLAGSGLGAALVRLAGGKWMVIGSVTMAEACYLVTARGEATWDGVFEAALLGYLQAVGFRVLAPVGRWVGGKLLGAAGVRIASGGQTRLDLGRALLALAADKAVVGAGGGATGEVLDLTLKDVVTVVLRGGRPAHWKEYLARAGRGALLGALAEFGVGPGLAILLGGRGGTSLMRIAAASKRTSARLIGALSHLRTAREVAEFLAKRKVSVEQLLAEVTPALSRLNAWLRSAVRDPQVAAEGVKAFAEQVRELAGMLRVASAQIARRGAKNVLASVQDSILGLAQVELSRQAARGLRRILRDQRLRISPEMLKTLVEELLAHPERIDGVLGLLGAVDRATLQRLLSRERLTELVRAGGLASLSPRLSAADLRVLLQDGFDGEVLALDRWAQRLQALPPPTQAEILAALRLHGGSLTPNAAMTLAQLGVPLEAQVLGGIDRLARVSSRAAVDALIAAQPRSLVEVLMTAATDVDAAWMLRALMTDVGLGVRVLDRMATLGELRDLLAAASADLGFLHRVLELTGVPKGGPYLETQEVFGLIDLLLASKAASEDAILKLLRDPLRARAFLRAAADADEPLLMQALGRGDFPRRYGLKEMLHGRGENVVNPYGLRQPVIYLNERERLRYRIAIRDGRLLAADGRPFDTLHVEWQEKPGWALFVMDGHGEIYASNDGAFGVFHHSSLTAGGPIAAAGEMKVDRGTILEMNNISGHYFPEPAFLEQMLAELRRRGVDVDAIHQQFFPWKGPPQ